MRRLAFALFTASAGCSDMMADHDRNVFGEDMGEFHVVANLEETSCGAGAADAPEEWEFDIRLSHDGSQLFWNTGAAAVEGEIASDGISFALVSQTRVELSAPTDGAPGCTMLRDDAASGTFDRPQGAGRFTGTLSYAFSVAENSVCDGFVGVPGGFAALPCTMHYEIAGTSTNLRSDPATASR